MKKPSISASREEIQLYILQCQSEYLKKNNIKIGVKNENGIVTSINLVPMSKKITVEYNFNTDKTYIVSC